MTNSALGFIIIFFIQVFFPALSSAKEKKAEKIYLFSKQAEASAMLDSIPVKRVQEKKPDEKNSSGSNKPEIKKPDTKKPETKKPDIKAIPNARPKLKPIVPGKGKIKPVKVPKPKIIKHLRVF